MSRKNKNEYHTIWRDLLIAIGYAKLKIPVADLAKIFGLTRQAVYKIIKKK